MVYQNWLNKLLENIDPVKRDLDFELVKLNPFMIEGLAVNSYNINDHVYSRNLNYARKSSSCVVLAFNAISIFYMVKLKSFKKGFFMGIYTIRNNKTLFALSVIAYPEYRLFFNKQRLRTIIASDEYKALKKNDEEKMKEIRRLEFFKENCMSPNYLYELNKTVIKSRANSTDIQVVEFKPRANVKIVKDNGSDQFSLDRVHMIQKRFGIDFTQLI